MASKTSRRVLIVISILVVVGILWIAAFAVIGLSGALPGFGGAYGGDFEEVLLEEGDSRDKVVMINVVGEIFSDPEGLAAGASDYNVIGQLEQAADDPDTVAIILHVDSPGGGVLASDAIHREVSEIDEDIPVVSLMGDLAASGGYYISAPASSIVAHRFTWTGSIGVISMIPDLSGAADKLGIEVAIVKSGEFKDLGSPLSDLTDEERQIFQDLVVEAYDGFVEVVAEGRDLPEDEVRALADGRIYSGLQAEELGLVDEIGDRDTAFERAKDLADSENARLVAYQPIPGFIDSLGLFGIDNPVDRIAGELGLHRSPGPAYLWVP